MKTINVKGPIISNDEAWLYDWFDMEYTCPKNVLSQIKEANGEDIEFNINSGGGSVFDAYEIYNAIAGYQGNTVAKISLAASAASFIALATDRTIIGNVGNIMIHKASDGMHGNADEHRENADFLDKIDNTIVNAYIEKTGKERDEILKLMAKTTWFTPEEALEIGIVDEISSKKIKTKAFNTTDEEKQKMINKLLELGSVENIKKAFIDNQITIGQTVANSTFENTSKEKGGEKMTLDQFKSEHVEIYNQVVDTTVKQERLRVAEINALAKPGTENQIKEGIENGLTAGEVAINILNAQTALNKSMWEAIVQDAEDSGLCDVCAAPIPTSSHAVDKQQSVNLLVSARNKIIGGKK